MLKKYHIIFCFILFTGVISAQTKTSFFPDDLLIQPFTANQLEPKLGFLFQTGANELRLDIGNSIDILRKEFEGDFIISFGADLFTYTFLRGESNFHFPVDAVDYLFGLNFGLLKSNESYELGFRFRLSHISAHFVDGHFDGTSGTWKDGLNPRVYSREFIELIPFYKTGDLRVYAGFTYLFHVDPFDIKKDNYKLGFDYFFDQSFTNLFIPFAAYDLTIIHLNKYTANHSVSAGIKFGKKEGKGFSVYFNYYAGKSIHGEYFDRTVNYSAIGLNLDL